MKSTTIIVALVAAVAVGAGVYAYLPAKQVAPATKGHGHGGGAHDHADEGVVEMSDAKVHAANIQILTATETILKNSLLLNGVLQPNQEALVQVAPRFPGVIREIKKRVGDVVQKGDLLATVESNQSLTTYEMRAPISGTIIDRQISLGEYASEQKPAFVVADVSTVWVDLTVYKRDLPRVKVGDTVVIDVGDGGQPIETKISYLSPVASSDTQSTFVRAVVSNDAMRLRPGLFVSARLILTARHVTVAVHTSALQTLDNRSVVFVRSGNTFEARDVELGVRDSENVEIVFGLMDGDRYAARNSFVVKAEIAKGSAAHDH